MIHIKSLSLKNFKCFESLEPIELGKITLLTGANSAGKSSLYHSLLGALQTEGYPLQYSPNGAFALMGDYTEIVFKHEKVRDIEMEFSLEDDGITYYFKTIWSLPTFQSIPYMKQITCKADYYAYTIKGREEDNQILYTIDLKYNASLNKSAKAEQDKTIDGFVSMAKSQHNSNIDSDKIKYLISSLFAPIDVKDLPLTIDDKLLCSIADNQQASMEMALAFNNTKRVLDKFRKQFNVISSYRRPAQRSYIDEAKSAGRISPDGEGFVTELMNWRENDNQKFEACKNTLQKMDILYDLEPSRIDAGNYKISVKVKKGNEYVNLSDVGYGVAQIMPFVVADVQLPVTSTLFIAQPEIHLHPNIQANLADYFTSQINSTEKNYVVETHSEYMINRFRLAIAKGELKESDIRVYYIGQKDGNTHVYPVELKNNGTICGAPDEFFETYMMDVMNLAMEASE